MTAPGADSGALLAELAATFGHTPSEIHTASGFTGRFGCANCFTAWPCAVVRKIERVMVPVAEAYARRRAAEELEDAAALMGHRPGSHLFLRAAALAAVDDNEEGRADG